MCFNSLQGKTNRGGRRQGNKNKTRSTDKKKLNPLDPAGNTTVCFNCGCKFHWSYDCPYVDSSRDEHGGENKKDLSYESAKMRVTLGSAVQDSGASSTICRTKWYKCFLETLTDVQKK